MTGNVIQKATFIILDAPKYVHDLLIKGKNIKAGLGSWLSGRMLHTMYEALGVSSSTSRI